MASHTCKAILLLTFCVTPLLGARARQARDIEDDGDTHSFSVGPGRFAYSEIHRLPDLHGEGRISPLTGLLQSMGRPTEALPWPEPEDDDLQSFSVGRGRFSTRRLFDLHGEGRISPPAGDETVPPRKPLQSLGRPTESLPWPDVSQNSLTTRLEQYTTLRNGMLNLNRSCLGHGCTGGPCPYCGTGFCCRKGSFRGGCDGISGHETQYVCTFAPPAPLGPRNLGKECWNMAQCVNGRCGYCGSGLCCRKGWRWARNGCNGKVGGAERHECVLFDYDIEFSEPKALEEAKGDEGLLQPKVRDNEISGQNIWPVGLAIKNSPESGAGDAHSTQAPKGEDAEKGQFQTVMPDYEAQSPDQEVSNKPTSAPQGPPVVPESGAQPSEEEVSQEETTQEPPLAGASSWALTGSLSDALLVLLVAASGVALYLIARNLE